MTRTPRRIRKLRTNFWEAVFNTVNMGRDMDKKLRIGDTVWSNGISGMIIKVKGEEIYIDWHTGEQVGEDKGKNKGITGDYCGPHCGTKDGYSRHCTECHFAERHGNLQ